MAKLLPAKSATVIMKGPYKVRTVYDDGVVVIENDNKNWCTTMPWGLAESLSRVWTAIIQPIRIGRLISSGMSP